ncbi:hypothetical protein FRACYDRAFT_267541 [Fragilariopsis cylindrus CCMP1102]|uniref:Uncharacterized protein n=1 Tax=Fragilariopsis cylindrus CCMP1102 TaxID=635003 RepID=A0A1E7FZ76_9STRA|nr:hypothetical protein FRACYDRAFT_267541 [Fragilariopsis cylindrus CCMP1102]|eukprot:OEU23446.1 hypothetical protein FRACYDRAFT_267541 [Fragilariopsis cylindrus CCMP1102]
MYEIFMWLKKVEGKKNTPPHQHIKRKCYCTTTCFSSTCASLSLQPIEGQLPIAE